MVSPWVSFTGFGTFYVARRPRRLVQAAPPPFRDSTYFAAASWEADALARALPSITLQTAACVRSAGATRGEWRTSEMPDKGNPEKTAAPLLEQLGEPRK